MNKSSILKIVIASAAAFCAVTFWVMTEKADTPAEASTIDSTRQIMLSTLIDCERIQKYLDSIRQVDRESQPPLRKPWTAPADFDDDSYLETR